MLRLGLEKARSGIARLMWEQFRSMLRIRGWYVRLLIRLMGGQCAGGLLVDQGFRFKYAPHAGISIGRDVFFGKNALLDVPPGGSLRIGDRAWFNLNTVLASSQRIEIGDDVQVAEFTSIRDGEHSLQLGVPMRDQPLTIAPVVIGRDVWIGRGVAVLKGSRIGDGAVIGANAVVRSIIPARAIAVGLPARVVKYRDTPTSEQFPPSLEAPVPIAQPLVQAQ